MNITAAIRACRAKYGLTQEQAAQKMGVSQSLFNAWESGHKLPTLSQVHRLSILFEIDDVFVEALVDIAFNKITEKLMSEGGVSMAQINAHRRKVIYYLDKLIQEDEKNATAECAENADRCEEQTDTK